MKYFISIFLVLIMAASVTVPLIEQLQGKDMCEMKEKNADDADDELKIGKEKDIYTFCLQIVGKLAAFLAENAREKQYYKHDCLISENHSFLPEIPPEV